MQSVSFMQSGLILLSELDEEDVDWLLAAGREERLAPNTVLVEQGSHPESLFLVLAGLLKVYLGWPGGKEVAANGPGQIIGEMSFLEKRPATATVVAVEDSAVLVLPREKLDAQLAQDPQFSARLYKALAIVGSRRLRDLMGTVSRWMEDQSSAPTAAGDNAQARIAERTQALKTALRQAQKDPASAEFAQLPKSLADFALYLNEAIGDAAPRAIDLKEDLGARVQREILPYLMQSALGNRFYTKPRGYPEDFLTLAHIYKNEPEGQDDLGPTLDRGLLDLPISEAVRNRRRIFADRILRAGRETGGSGRVTCLGCGPAEEIFDVIQESGGAERLQFTLIDPDAQALDHVAQRIAGTQAASRVVLRNEDIVHLSAGRMARGLPGQDLLCCIGLADYLSDRSVVALLDFAHSILKPGGEAVFSFFHTRNPSKALMDYVLDWRAAHRDESAINLLFQQSAFHAQPRLESEPQGAVVVAAAKR